MMTDNVVHLPGPDSVPSLFGPERSGHSVIIDGRVVPNLHAYDRGDTVDFVLDERMAFEFPRELAYLAASFAAEAMAIGAGFPSFRGERMRGFASPCSGIKPLA